MIDINNCFTYAYSAGTYADFYQTINTTEEVSTNAIDLDVVGIRIAGGSRPPWIIVKIGTVIAGSSVTGMEIKLITATAAALNAGVKAVKSWNFVVGTLLAKALVVNEPLGHFDYQRYLGMEFSPVGGTGSGTICAYLAGGPESAVTDLANTEAD